MSADRTTRPDVLAAFRSCRLWRTASEEAIKALAASAQVREVPRGAVLATEGDAANRVGVMISGRARVFYLGADGRQITFETLGAGDPVAAVAALAGARYPANIEAATPATVAFISAESLFELLERQPQVARTLVSDLASRVVNFTSVVQTLALDVPSRVARYVFHRSLQGGRPTPRGLEVELGMKKNELAMALGTVPETLSRAFAKLKDEGLLEVHGSTVTVLDVRALAALASGYGES